MSARPERTHLRVFCPKCHGVGFMMLFHEDGSFSRKCPCVWCSGTGSIERGGRRDERGR